MCPLFTLWADYVNKCCVLIGVKVFWSAQMADHGRPFNSTPDMCATGMAMKETLCRVCSLVLIIVIVKWHPIVGRDRR